MKILRFVLFLTLIPSISISQNLNFESEVREKESQVPVSDAIVAIEGTVLAVKTDENGKFVFTKPIPLGEHAVSITKEAYVTKYFLIKSQEDTKIVIDFIEIEITRDEAQRRKKEAKSLKKEEKKALKEAQKLKEEKEKIVEKQTKKLKRKNSVEVEYDQVEEEPIAEEPEVEPVLISEVQIKYADILGVSVDKVTNKDLYEFIDDWMGTTYLMGGETKDGIDCSAFTQFLSMKGLGLLIERTASKQYHSKYTNKFTDISELREGDLLFFKGFDANNSEIVSHVGFYLHNNKFVHSTGSRYDTGEKGVKISDITDPYWMKKFLSAGRRIVNN